MDKTYDKRKKVVYDLLCDDLYTPMKFKELAILLQVPKEQREELRTVLEALEREGKIYLSKRGKYVKGETKRLSGVYRANAKGFGFVETEGETPDVYIGEEYTGEALDGDTVEYAVIKDVPGKRSEGKIVKILSRGMTKVVGYYEMTPGRNYGFVMPDNQKFHKDIFIPAEKSKGAVTGHKVVVELTSYGGEGKKPEGKITEIIGHVNDPGTDIMSIVKGYDLPVEFPEKVLKQAERVSKPVSEADMAGRRDLRDIKMVTIDGEDAKDLDDAVSVERKGSDYILGVHIADVTNYVQENSALDHEARERGTSVYLVDRVIPMLPHTLSNGICSLNAGEDRLALSCIMTVDTKGNVIDHEILETVVHVDRRMTYTSVKKILEDHDEIERETYKEFVPMFECMQELSGLLREKRKQRGSIDFDFPEIIEDFMLLANETVAQDYYWQELPFVYRNHEAPDDEKIKALAAFINNFGYSMHIGVNEVRPKEVQKLLGRVEGTPEEALISRLALRSMRQARYAPQNSGHFGLAAAYYTHFTSPIRRYPDLQIHRIIKDNLRGRMNEDKIQHYHAILEEVTKHASVTERRADEAERESVWLKKVE